MSLNKVKQFATYIPDKGQVSFIYKELLYFSMKMTNFLATRSTSEIHSKEISLEMSIIVLTQKVTMESVGQGTYLRREWRSLT